MNTRTLFGEIALRLGVHPENVATEALCHILTVHTASWAALRTQLLSAGLSLPETLRFRTQVVAEDSAIPDLVGSDHDNLPVFMIEAKFWAALTDHQPGTYLHRLPEDRSAVLLFLAPTQRLPLLWPRLLQRCREAAFEPKELPTSTPALQLCSVGSMRVLGLTSWRAVLATLARDAEARRESAMSMDVYQLDGLCAQMDSSAFLPLRSEELGQDIGRRLQQLADLVDTVFTALVASGHATRGNLTTGGSQATYGRYFLMQNHGCFLCLSPRLWSTHGWPMWFWAKEGQGAKWNATQRIQEAVEGLAARRGVPVVDTPDGPTIPIELPTGVEESEVVASVVKQIREIAKQLPAGA